MEHCDGAFIQSYSQNPPLEVIAKRTRELDGIVQMSQFLKGYQGVGLGTGGEALEGRDSRRGVCLLPGPHETPRSVLDTLGILSLSDEGRIALQAPLCSLNDERFIRRAKDKGLVSWFILVDGQKPFSEVVQAAKALRRLDVWWGVRLGIDLVEAALIPSIDTLNSLGGGSVILEWAGGPSERIEEAISLLRAWGKRHPRAEGVSSVGLPACVLWESPHYALPAHPVFGDSRERAHVHEASCRTCKWSVHCPGASREAWDSGLFVANPIEGRPVLNPSISPNHSRWP